MGAFSGSAVAMTDDSTPTGRLLSVVTPRELRSAFGDDPAGILKDIGRAADAPALFALNMRARACALHHLTSPASTDWITRFLELADIGILTRLIALAGASDPSCCWCVSGASGRGESVTRRAPHILLIHKPLATTSTLNDRYARVVDGLADCGYIHDTATLDPAFNVASVDEWIQRYCAWVTNPVIEGMAKNRSLFDLRPLHRERTAWNDVRQRVMQAVDRDIVRILGHDCLATLPPLTFYQDAVVEESGEQTTVFRLQQSALGPLVDLGRVFGMTAQRVMGTSTIERFAIARHVLPEHEAIFRDASQALRIMLWQQGRIGISQGTTGAELPPTLLSRHDRHMLKSGFPAILQLLEFSADSAWLDAF
jgi:CBS domain-containing protein